MQAAGPTSAAVIDVTLQVGAHGAVIFHAAVAIAVGTHGVSVREWQALRR